MDLFDVAVAKTLSSSGGGGGGGLTKLFEKEYELNTTSTSKTVFATEKVEGCYTSDAIIYIRIRRKEGSAAGYHLGSELFLINANPVNGTQNNIYTNNIGTYILRTNADGKVQTIAQNPSSTSGVYVDQISTDEMIQFATKYNSTQTLTINGTYVVEVYSIPWPGGVSPFGV